MDNISIHYDSSLRRWMLADTILTVIRPILFAGLFVGFFKLLQHKTGRTFTDIISTARADMGGDCGIIYVTLFALIVIFMLPIFLYEFSRVSSGIKVFGYLIKDKPFIVFKDTGIVVNNYLDSFSNDKNIENIEIEYKHIKRMYYTLTNDIYEPDVKLAGLEKTIYLDTITISHANGNVDIEYRDIYSLDQKLLILQLIKRIDKELEYKKHI